MSHEPVAVVDDSCFTIFFFLDIEDCNSSFMDDFPVARVTYLPPKSGQIVGTENDDLSRNAGLKRIWSKSDPFQVCDI